MTPPRLMVKTLNGFDRIAKIFRCLKGQTIKCVLFTENTWDISLEVRQPIIKGDSSIVWIILLKGWKDIWFDLRYTWYAGQTRVKLANRDTVHSAVLISLQAEPLFPAVGWYWVVSHDSPCHTSLYKTSNFRVNDSNNHFPSLQHKVGKFKILCISQSSGTTVCSPPLTVQETNTRFPRCNWQKQGQPEQCIIKRSYLFGISHSWFLLKLTEMMVLLFAASNTSSGIKVACLSLSKKQFKKIKHSQQSKKYVITISYF